MRDPSAATLLAWYDAHARDLPWRVGPSERKAGKVPDPYHVWLSEIMLQQTTVAAVRSCFLRFVERWPDLRSLAAAEDSHVMAEWAGLGYYARARNLLKCARTIVQDLDGRFPETHEDLLRLPGVGPYTAAAVSAIVFERPETVVDGNVERVMSRLFNVETPLPKAKPELVALATRLTPAHRPGDYAQAVMDLGATICTPKSPACGICPWARACQARAACRQLELPKRAARPARPVRYGIAYLARRADGAWLLQTRPERGLLGGMLGWPGTEWTANPPEEAPPVAGQWRDPGVEVRHGFTHFELRLSLRMAELQDDAKPDRGHFVADLRREELPSVMRKALDIVAKGIPERAD
ncbi:MAG: A/G-specific adenine glycosylase [Boseongicola sp. SB0664_bin_43]|uniref:Adenine DNA glycosylase n=1 Tax=Boseongicola sp. SB0664_bin_43 TaxID=2604844 RepID=A0A6B0Y1I3_9RHOB|nr:A/G-specific adenine glycosylase [Boseongicola sp. SB0664_bin_43]